LGKKKEEKRRKGKKKKKKVFHEKIKNFFAIERNILFCGRREIFLKNSLLSIKYFSPTLYLSDSLV